MWTLLFLGHGIILCLYSQEWYAHQYCPLKNVSNPMDMINQETGLNYCLGHEAQYLNIKLKLYKIQILNIGILILAVDTFAFKKTIDGGICLSHGDICNAETC